MREPDYSILSKLRAPTSQNAKLRKSIVGQTFGRLTIYALMGHERTRQAMSFWLCRCRCNNFRIVAKGKLTSGRTISCGCYKKELLKSGAMSRSHGLSKTRLYRIWGWIYTRCYNHNSENYPDYGGRGIQMCDRWLIFQTFREDVGEPPSDKHSIDRIDVNGNYEPSNWRWATQIEQARNKRNNHLITANGETRCLAAWAELTGLKQGLIARRIRRGWPVDEALEFKERKRRRKSL